MKNISPTLVMDFNSVSFSLYQYVTLRTKYSELMTLTSQYIKFITDTQRRLEDEEVRENCLRVPNKLNSNTKLTVKANNRPNHRAFYRRSLQRTHALTQFPKKKKKTHIHIF